MFYLEEIISLKIGKISWWVLLNGNGLMWYDLIQGNGSGVTYQTNLNLSDLISQNGFAKLDLMTLSNYCKKEFTMLFQKAG